MENNNITNIEEGNLSDKLIYLSPPLESNYFSFYHSFQFTEDIKNSNIQIRKNGVFFYIDYSLENKSEQINCHQDNLENVLKKLVSLQNTHRIDESSLYSQRAIKSLSLIEKPFEYLINVANTSSSLENFLINLHQKNFFNKFSSIYLFKQQKGHSIADCLYLQDQHINYESISTLEFNRLFQAIKKSKIDSFGQSTLKTSSFKIIGTCLAKELVLHDHNIIFILTNNDFLPQKAEDYELFKNTMNALGFIINSYLKEDFFQTQTENNESLIKCITSNSLGQLNSDHFLKRLEQIKKQHFNLLDVNHKERISLLGELLNTLKHELSNPLFGLQLSTQLLELELIPIDSRDFVKEIENAIKRSQSIISNFSDLYFNQSKTESIELIKLLKEVITLTKSRSKHIRKEIFLNGKLINSNDQIHVQTNKTLLAQVFFNLILNSTQALRENLKSPFINIKLATYSEKIEILVEDNGPGLALFTDEQIFSPFFTTKKDGTGLGLSICKNILHKLNGTIENLPSDNGAKFLIKLPYEYFSY